MKKTTISFILQGLFLCTTLGSHAHTTGQQSVGEDSVTIVQQTDDKTKEEADQTQEEPVYSFDKVDQKAEFPGGFSAFQAFINNNIRYPKKAIKDNIQGKVFMGFFIEKDGTISHVTVVKSLHPILDKEAVIRLSRFFEKQRHHSRTNRRE